MSNLYIQKEGFIAKKYKCSFGFEHEKYVSADVVLESMKDAFIDRIENLSMELSLQLDRFGQLDVNL